MAPGAASKVYNFPAQFENICPKPIDTMIEQTMEYNRPSQKAGITHIENSNAILIQTIDILDVVLFFSVCL